MGSLVVFDHVTLVKMLITRSLLIVSIAVFSKPHIYNLD